MATISFDYNGSAVVINNRPESIIWRKVALYLGPTVLYNYQLLINFTDAAGIMRNIAFRLYTQALTVRIYEVANMVGMTDSIDIAESDSINVSMVTNFSRQYYNDLAFTLEVQNISSDPDADGIFSGDLNYYAVTPTINPSIPLFTMPSPADVINITNGNFRDVPIEV